MIGPKRPCRHGVDPSICHACRADRRAAKKGAATRFANGTNWGRSEFWPWDQPHASLREWLVRSRSHHGKQAIVLTRNGVVFSANKSPVWIVDRETYFVEELVTRERLGELLRGRIVLGSDEPGLWAPFARLTIAPESAIERPPHLRAPARQVGTSERRPWISSGRRCPVSLMFAVCNRGVDLPLVPPPAFHATVGRNRGPCNQHRGSTASTLSTVVTVEGGGEPCRRHPPRRSRNRRSRGRRVEIATPGASPRVSANRRELAPCPNAALACPCGVSSQVGTWFGSSAPPIARQRGEERASSAPSNMRARRKPAKISRCTDWARACRVCRRDLCPEFVPAP